PVLRLADVPRRGVADAATVRLVRRIALPDPAGGGMRTGASTDTRKTIADAPEVRAATAGHTDAAGHAGIARISFRGRRISRPVRWCSAPASPARRWRARRAGRPAR